MTIALSPPTLPSGAVGATYSQTLTASGGTAPYTFAVTVGTLPSGLSLNGTTGVISGTLTAAGTSTFTITATDSAGTPATGAQAYSITVQAIAIFPTALPSGAKDSGYSQTLTAFGGTAPYTFAVSAGALPAGLALDGSTGIISGLPTALGSSSFTITATDSASATGTQAYVVLITGSIYWFICTNAAPMPAVHHVAANQAEFNRKVAHALSVIAKSRTDVGHLIARPTSDLFDGHLLCDGSTISRTDFPQLFASIGETWGPGDGTTTFSLPNLVTSPLPVATVAPTQTVTPTTVSSSTTTVTAPTGEASTGGSTGGNTSSGGVDRKSIP